MNGKLGTWLLLPTWAVSPPIVYILHRHLLLLSPKANTHVTVPRSVEGTQGVRNLPEATRPKPRPGSRTKRNDIVRRYRQMCPTPRREHEQLFTVCRLLAKD